MKWQSSQEILEAIVSESKNPIIDQRNLNILGFYIILIALFGIAFVSSAQMILIIIGMGLLGGAAQMLQSILASVRKEENFRIVAKNYRLFPSPDACVEYMYLNNLVFGRYSDGWKLRIYFQPILSIIAGLAVHFVLRSIIQISMGGNMSGEPNIYFYGFFAFISGFFYEKFLDYLNGFSQKLSKGLHMNDQIMTKIKDFENFKGKVSLKVKKELKK